MNLILLIYIIGAGIAFHIMDEQYIKDVNNGKMIDEEYANASLLVGSLLSWILVLVFLYNKYYGNK